LPKLSLPRQCCQARTPFAAHSGIVFLFALLLVLVVLLPLVLLVVRLALVVLVLLLVRLLRCAVVRPCCVGRSS
jgi:hypothetical protein